MKFGYSIDENRRVIFLEFSGDFDAAAFIACLERLWADPAYRRDYEGIADVRELANTYSLSDLQRVIAFLKNNPRTNTARWAVITSSPLAAACSYVYRKAMSPVHRVEVFSTWEAAAAFLGWDAARPSLAEHTLG